MEAPTVTIGDITTTLCEPSPLFALAIAAAPPTEISVVAMGAASLAACWPTDTTWPARPRPIPWRTTKNVADYGHEVYDALRLATRGRVPLRDMNAACLAALQWARTCLLTEAEVQAAEGFSEPPQGG